MMIEIPAWYVEWFWLIAIVGIFDLVLKAFALWHSARGRQLVWFIFLMIMNTAGILPIIYLLFFKKKESVGKPAKRKS